MWRESNVGAVKKERRKKEKGKEEEEDCGACGT